MATFYLDYVNGNDANDGTTWALAWKTITTGATAAIIAPGDIIRIAKSPAPTVLVGATGNAAWNGTGVAPTKAMGSSTNATPIVVTITGHGYSTDDYVQITGHTVNTNANGFWKITVVNANTFSLQDVLGNNSVGNGVGAATGTCAKANGKVILMTDAQTAAIDRCEVAWTGAGDVTATLLGVTTDAKEGSNCTNLAVDDTPQASILQAYKATGALDLSTYQKISFWIKNEAAIANATTWVVKLCSDTAGVTEVDAFVIPAIPSIGRWIPLTITRNGGSNLGATIQSIAIYSGATAPAASKYIRIDNFIACTTDGLNLQSLISKNSAEQGGTEGWYGIQSINGVTVLLDNDTNTKADDGRGYSGATETVTTYKRETIKTALASAAGTAVQDVMKSGSLAVGNIQFQGGWNTTTTVQEGETFFDGLNGFGYGIRHSSKSYITLNYLNFSRYNYGVYYYNSNNNLITTLSNANNNTNYGVYYYVYSDNNIITTLSNANNNSNGVFYNNNINNTITTLSNANNNSNGVCYYVSNNNTITTLSNANNNSNGVYYNSSNNNTITTLSNANNNNYGVYYYSNNNNTIKLLSTSGNTTAGVYNNIGINYINNALIAEATEVTGYTPFVNSRIFSNKHDQTADNHWVFTDGGTINSQATTRHTASGIAWKYAITSANRASNYPLKMDIAKIAVSANNLVTVKVWVFKDSAAGIAAKLVCPGAQIAGVPNDVVATAADVLQDWEQISIEFTPTEAGVVAIEGHGIYVSAVSNIYFDDISISQV